MWGAMVVLITVLRIGGVIRRLSLLVDLFRLRSGSHSRVGLTGASFRMDAFSRTAVSCMVVSMAAFMMGMVSTVDSMAQLLDSMAGLRVGFMGEV
jgi:hypothetical protein